MKDTAAAVLVGLVLWGFLGPSAPDYDAMFALAWGDDVAAGRSPEIDVPYAPAARPLTIAIGALLSPLGDAAADVFRLLVFLALGAACVALFRLGRELWGTAAGVLAAAILATRHEALGLASQGFVDVPATALVLWAAVLVQQGARSPVALLVLAALLRPELFVLCLAYAVWVGIEHGRGAFLRAAAISAIVPLVYVGGLALIAGDAVQGRSATLEEVGSQTGFLTAIEVLVRAEWGFLGPPLVIAALAGGVLWLWRERRAAAVLLAVAALDAAAFLALGIAGEPTEPRYVLPVSAIAALAAAYALSEALRRRAGTVALAAAVLLLGASAVRDAVRAVDLRGDVRLGDRVQDDLRDVAERADAAGALERGLRPGTARPVPYVALWTGIPPSKLAAREDESLPRLEPLTYDASQLLGRGIPDEDDDGAAPAVPAEVLVRNESWAVAR